MLALHASGFVLLRRLMEASPGCVPREELCALLWPEGAPGSDPLRMHVYQLRQQFAASFGQPFALIGLSDSANLVAFYDQGPWQIRAAYNWRDQFLSGVFDGSGPNPNYVEEYGQFDLSIGYQVTDRLSLQFEGINLTDETNRVHGRHVNEVLYLTQTGPRYMFGMRYKF